MDEATYIYGQSTETTAQLREVKVKLPVQQLVTLHGMKILRGTTISETVAEALAQYFLVQEEATASRPVED